MQKEERTNNITCARQLGTDCLCRQHWRGRQGARRRRRRALAPLIFTCSAPSALPLPSPAPPVFFLLSFLALTYVRHVKR